MLLVLGLGAALVNSHSISRHQRVQDLGAINQFSNAWHDVSQKLDEQTVANLALERDLAAASEIGNTIPDSTPKAALPPATVTAPLPEADPNIAEFQKERDQFTTQLNGLTNALANLDRQMAEAQRKLQDSEGDRTALLRNLKRLEAERADLLQQFNDLALLRQQLRRLKAEQAISRRLDWIRRGLFGNPKGAELLHQVATAAPASGNYDLNVEMRRDGGAKVVAPAH